MGFLGVCATSGVAKDQKYAWSETKQESISSMISQYIDHAVLHPTNTEDDLRAACKKAPQWGVATVCVRPCDVALAAELLKGTSVGVSTVIGFPHGANASCIKAAESRLACEQGATELDMVVNIGRVHGADWDYVEQDIRAVVETGREFGALTKVIFENALLVGDEQKIELCKICISVGAAFVKTSTGFGFHKIPDGYFVAGGATDHDLQLMRENCGDLGLKASGGIRTYDDALRVVQLGATRIGTSATEAILEGEAVHPVTAVMEEDDNS